MLQKPLVVLLVLLVAFSGCIQQAPTLGIESNEEPSTPAATPTPQPESSTTTTATPLGTTTQPSTSVGNNSTAAKSDNSIEQPPPLPDYLTERYESEKYPERNPHLTRKVTVNIQTSGENTRNFRPHVKGAFRWWQQNATAFFGAGNYTYSLTDNASNATVVVKFVPEAEKYCGYVEGRNVVGCAPILDEEYSMVRPAHVYIETGMDDGPTAYTVAHELGHVFGKTHDSHAPVMKKGTSHSIPLYNQSWNASREPGDLNADEIMSSSSTQW
ncbi:zinc-dependent metalloprotease family protein [Haloprofundus salilacus]|uniref:zinc-dependent metalloprotease family protein n=1 Tax=Haloprofundus salilacus TaxID=2876190 RepID=UPI001CC905DF|nr:zinc-dependent metalloprotease family protein [Haloprofundus salilacus]